MWNDCLAQLGIKLKDKVLTIQTDSRAIKPGDLFIALNSGFQYIDEALLRGAVCVISPKEHMHAKVITVEDTTLWLMALAKLYRQSLKTLVIGVTGSVGKTSMVQMLGQCLGRYAKTYHTQGNENNEIGVAKTLIATPIDAQYLIIEMGVAKSMDMDALVDMVNPSIGVITHIGPSHLAGLNSSKGVWEEKRKMLRLCNWCIVEEGYDKDYRGRVTTFGISQQSDVVIGDRGVIIGDKQYVVSLPEGFAYRMRFYAIAYAIYDYLNLIPNFTDIVWPLGRMSCIEHPSGAMIFDDSYNANILSYHVALRNIRQYPQPIVILGEMGGLGHQSKHYHELLGLMLNYHQIAQVWAYGDLHQYTLLTYLGELNWYHDKSQLKEDLCSALKPGQYVLVKGSRHLQLEELLDV